MKHMMRSKITKSLALLLSLWLVLTSTGGGTLAYIVNRTPVLQNTFLSGLEPEGDLVIEKTVTHPFGRTYTLPEGLTFDFTVALGASYAGKTVETNGEPVTADESGNITLSVAPGSPVTLRGLAEGTAVTVKEATKPGFTPQGGAARSLVIRRGENRVSYINDYEPKPVSPVNVTVEGTKVLEGRDWQDGDSFTFRLEYRPMGAGDWQELATAAVVYATVEVTDPETGDVTAVPVEGFDRFSFTEAVQAVTYDAAGVYAFRVSEVTGTIGGVSYDQVVSYFDVTVRDADMDGALEIGKVEAFQNAAASYDDNAKQHRVNVTVSNQYAPEGTATATIQIHKTMKDLSGAEKSPAGYTFELYDESGALVTTSGATSAAGETSIALTYEAKDAGQTFCYTLQETNAGKKVAGLRYDDTVYDVFVTVVDDLDGTVSAQITAMVPVETPPVVETPPATEETPAVEELPATEELPVVEEPPVVPTDHCEAAFENVYEPKDALVFLSGTKTLTGRQWQKGDSFTFYLYEADENFAVKGAGSVATAVCTNGETFDFVPLGFGGVGTFRYVVKEAGGGKTVHGVTYDDTIYRVTVTVTDEGGELTAAAVITDEGGAAATLAFENTYCAAAAEVTVAGTKILKGGELKRDQFQFQIYEADENYAAAEFPLAGTSNDGEGRFAFDALRFEAPGIYYYTVAEDDSAALPGVTYDKTVYGLRVEVTDGGKGKLEADVACCQVGGGTVESLTFRNTYVDPKPESPLTGDASAPGLYAALLTVSLAAAAVMLLTRNRKRQR